MLAGGLLMVSCAGGTTGDSTPDAVADTVVTTSPDGSASRLPAGFDIEGHRGARGLKPENTLPAFEVGMDVGVTTLELDLHFSADGEVVIWHDPTINPKKCALKPGAPSDVPNPDDPDVPDTALAIRSLTVAQLRWFQCNRNPDPGRFPEQDPSPTALAGDDYGIVTLGDLIDFVDRYAEADEKSSDQRAAAAVVGFNIETKREFGDPGAIGDGFDGENIGPFEQRLLAVIAERGIRDRAMVQSFDTRSLEAIHRADPGIRLSALSVGGDADPGGYAKLGASVWSPQASTISARRMTEAKDAGLAVIPWTVNDPSIVDVLIAAGADGVITDRPDLFADR